jgi:hypothetical protein
LIWRDSESPARLRESCACAQVDQR